ncbi:MAG: DUF2799 domain-containing protein [Kordiimonadaceae bacterium]|nr:DUF2799 domain-containing protein [Kordiimonadaceae bacterium]
MKKTLTFVIPAFLVLGGCSKMMNKNQCVVADWRTIGYEDGNMGRSEQWLSKRREICAEYGVSPDLDAYLYGRNEGLQNFCQPRRGFDLGNRGIRYENVCPSNLETNFVNAYQDGLGLRDRQIHVNEIDRALTSAQAQLKSLEDQITADTLSLATTDMSNQERIDTALAIKKKAEKSGELKERIPQLTAELGAAQYDLDAYRESIAPRYQGAI